MKAENTIQRTPVFGGDKIIWIVTFILMFLSVLLVFSTSSIMPYTTGIKSSPTGILLRHLMFLVVGLMVMYAVHKMPYQYFIKLSQILTGASVVFLLMALAVGTSKNQAARWIELPLIGAFQPSDLAKVALVLYLARLLAGMEHTPEGYKKTYIHAAAVIGGFCGLVIADNLSTGLFFALIGFVMLWVGQLPSRYIKRIALLVAGAGMFFILISMAGGGGRVATWKNRIVNYASGDKTKNFQAKHAQIAIAQGGIVGKMPGNSTQKHFVSSAFSDFIFAIIIEEYGLWGMTLVIGLYLFLFYRSILIVKRCKGRFAALLVAGLSTVIVTQAFINICVNVGLFPVTGQNLPLISRGGTSILITCMAIGMILSVDRHNRLESQTQNQQST